MDFINSKWSITGIIKYLACTNARVLRAEFRCEIQQHMPNITKNIVVVEAVFIVRCARSSE